MWHDLCIRMVLQHNARARLVGVKKRKKTLVGRLFFSFVAVQSDVGYKTDEVTTNQIRDSFFSSPANADRDLKTRVFHCTSGKRVWIHVGFSHATCVR